MITNRYLIPLLLLLLLLVNCRREDNQQVPSPVGTVITIPTAVPSATSQTTPTRNVPTAVATVALTVAPTTASTIASTAAPTAFASPTATLPGPSQPMRITFGAGAVSATVNGTLAAGGELETYVLRANAGQLMTIAVTANPAGTVTVFVRDATGQLLASGTDEKGLNLGLPTTGDYFIDVASPGAAPDVGYTLEVSIPASAPPTPQPVRIQFAAGATSATVSETLAFGGDVDTWVLRALAGQTMTLNVTASEAGWMNIFVYDQNNQFLGSGTEASGVNINLPANQDYIILVSSINAAPPLNYTMVVTIQ
jgi:hypothetical protein